MKHFYIVLCEYVLYLYINVLLFIIIRGTNNMKYSIIIPVYNSEICIRKRLDSISKQIFNDFEVIIIDDGSTEGNKNLKIK